VGNGLAERMSGDTLRTVSIERTGKARYDVHNVRGGTMSIGEGADTDFTPVELLLAAIAGCTAIDIDYITGKRAEPVELSATATGDKIRSTEHGNHLTNLELTLTVTFPEGEGGDAAREALPMALRRSHERLCTVGRTIEAGTPITMELSR
jgi:putative redox protein